MILGRACVTKRPVASNPLSHPRACPHLGYMSENEFSGADAFWLGLVDSLRPDLAAPPSS